MDVKRFDETVENHLQRYIENRNKRTGQLWRVVRRFQTVQRSMWERGYDRAYIVNTIDTRVRIYYDVLSRCWKRA